MEEEQTTQWPKERVQKDKQRSTNHTHKTKDRVTQTPLKTEKVQKDKQQSTNYTHKTKDRVTRIPLKTEKVEKDKQRSTNHTHKTKDRVTQTPLKTGCELRCCGKVSSSCSTSCTRRVNLVANPVISHE